MERKREATMDFAANIEKVREVRQDFNENFHELQAPSFITSAAGTGEH